VEVKGSPNSSNKTISESLMLSDASNTIVVPGDLYRFLQIWFGDADITITVQCKPFIPNSPMSPCCRMPILSSSTNNNLNEPTSSLEEEESKRRLSTVNSENFVNLHLPNQAFAQS